MELHHEPKAGASGSARAAMDLRQGAVLASLFALLCLLGAGMVLWASHGPSIFANMVSAAIAWCF